MRRTPLYESHKRAGARFVEFGGWEMPVQYRGILAEHAAVRTQAGLFDVSHMGEIEVSGTGALALCQEIATNDAARLAVGQAQYTLWCDETGGTIDDTILYRTGDDRYFFCVNASNAPTCSAWIAERARGRRDVAVRDASDETALLALQGPNAAAIAERAGAPELRALPRFACTRATVAGVACTAARTGYTGEDGFELFARATDAVALWDALLEAGAPLGLEPIGLGARDTLRLEAGLPLYGHELSREISPLEAGVGWAVKLEKGDFVGAAALARAKREGLARRLVGLEIVDAGIARADHPVLAGDERVGAVTSGTKSPTLGVAIALALVRREALDAALAVEVRGRRLSAKRVALPFYRRSSSDGGN
ncbi:MAG TPA: glycine cleavage system aminomethyltransferase GcvT [Candidatus Binatia bacterium]|nr:glycine cleavage system aminomethyltransferase GcvT [Candidatus Binatia bacterium]